MRHFYRSHLSPARVLETADEFFPALGVAQQTTAPRARTFSGPLGNYLTVLRSHFADARTLILGKEPSTDELRRLLFLGIQGFVSYDEVAAAIQATLQAAELNVDNLRQVLLIEAVEDDDIINTVEKFRTEMRTQLIADETLYMSRPQYASSWRHSFAFMVAAKSLGLPWRWRSRWSASAPGGACQVTSRPPGRRLRGRFV